MTIDYNKINEFRELSAFNSKTALEQYAKETHNIDLPRNITFDAMLAKLEDALKEPVVESNPEIVEPTKVEANKMMEPEVVEVKEVVEETKPVVEEVKPKINTTSIAPASVAKNKPSQRSINLMAEATAFANEVALDVTPQFHETQNALILGSLRRDFVAALKQHIDVNGASWLTAAADWDKTNVPLVNTDNEQLNKFIDYMKIVVTGAVAEDLDVIIRDSIDGRYIHVTDSDYSVTGAIKPIPVQPLPDVYIGTLTVGTGAVQNASLFGMLDETGLPDPFGAIAPGTFTVNSVVYDIDMLYASALNSTVNLKVSVSETATWSYADITIGGITTRVQRSGVSYIGSSAALSSYLQAANGTDVPVVIAFFA